MPLKDLKYKNDQSIIKVYGYGEKKKIKVITMNSLRTAGVEDDSETNPLRGSVNDTKLEESIIRAKSKIFELAFCNPWDYFFTGTLNQKFYDRSNLEKYHNDLTQWVRNQRKKLNCQIEFLLIPELHNDGKSWHMHGFIYGLPKTELKQFKIGDKMSKVLADKVRLGFDIYNWPAYAQKFGFCDLEPIRHAEAISKYVTKYINKNLATSVKELNAHLYYRSRGLKMSQTIKKGSLSMAEDILPSFENEHCKIYWLDYNEQTLQMLCNSIYTIDYYNHKIK